MRAKETLQTSNSPQTTHEYPIYKIITGSKGDSTLVKFVSPKKGYVVYSDHGYKVGLERDCWPEERFEVFRGKMIIENEP